jgi:transcriptional regulator with XRE-family HTH domain
MKDRIILLIKAMNQTAAQFADEIGVQKSSISHIISGRNNASLDFIQKILFRYPEVNMDWLMFGKGPIFKSSESIANVSIDQRLSAVSSHNSPPVDLFSEVLPAQPTEFRTENELRNETQLTDNTKQDDTNNASSIPVIEKPVIEKREQEVIVPARQPENPVSSSGYKNTSTKSLVKIVEFYSDNTYREYFPE